MKILLISNMYRGSDTPHLGRFVKNAADSLRNNGHDIELCVLNKISKSKVTKIYNYLVFYISILVKVLLTKSDCLYLHYASHCYLPVKMGNCVRRKKLWCTYTAVTLSGSTEPVECSFVLRRQLFLMR